MHPVPARLPRLLACLLVMLLGMPGRAPAREVADFRLANGMQVVVLPDHRLPVVSHVLFYRVGSADDPPGRSGVAHFLEHLMFKGTPSHPAGTFDVLVNRSGGATNAFTSTDETYYYEQVLADRLGLMMELGADRMRNLGFPPVEAERELGVVLEERRSYDNDPGAELGRRVDRALYGRHPYALPVLGRPEETAGLTYEAALDFYRQHYQPGSAILVVAGDAEPKEVLRLAEATYGRLAAGPAVPDRPWIERAPSCARHRLQLAHPRAARLRLEMSFLTAGAGALDTRSQAALEVLAEILAADAISPLHQEIVVDQGLANETGAGFTLSLAAGLLDISVEAGESDELGPLERSLRALVKRIARRGFTAEQLAIGRQAVIDAALLSADDQLQAATEFGQRLTSGASVATVAGWSDVVASVELADLNRVARQYLDLRCATTSILRPGGASSGQ